MKLNKREKMKERCFKYLGGKVCSECKSDTFNPICYEFHHRDPNRKSFVISSVLGTSIPWEELKKELDKCDVVCRNCHMVISIKNRNVGRRVKKGLEKVTKVRISLSPQSVIFLNETLVSRGLEKKGNFSSLINELVGLHHETKNYREMMIAYHKEKLDLLGGT